MGAWGTGHFDNDSALDLLADLYPREDGCGLLQEALEHALADGDEVYVGASGYSQALAAAEVVAALAGVPSEHLREEVSDWVLYRRPVERDTLANLASLAGKVARHIGEGSELRELWEESDSLDEWLAEVDELARRLEGLFVDGDFVENGSGENGSGEDGPEASASRRFGGPWDSAVDLDIDRTVTPVEDLLVDHIIADLDNGWLYLTSHFPLTALDLHTGQMRWQSYEAVRPLMLIGDVLLAQHSPARLPFKNLHLVLLDAATGEPLETFKVRCDDMLVSGLAQKEGFLRTEARLANGQVYVTWESGLYPASDDASRGASSNVKRSRGALCFDPATNQLAVIDPDDVPPQDSGEPDKRLDLREIAQVDLSSALGGPYYLGDEVAVLSRASTSPARTPEARRPPRASRHGGLGAVVMHHWDAHTEKRRADVTLLAHAGPDVTVGTSLNRKYIWVREQDLTATPVFRHHIFDATTYEALACVATNKELGSLTTRLGEVYIFSHYLPIMHGVDADTGEILWEHKLR